LLPWAGLLSRRLSLAPPSRVRSGTEGCYCLFAAIFAHTTRREIVRRWCYERYAFCQAFAILSTMPVACPRRVLTMGAGCATAMTRARLAGAGSIPSSAPGEKPGQASPPARSCRTAIIVEVVGDAVTRWDSLVRRGRAGTWCVAVGRVAGRRRHRLELSPGAALITAPCDGRRAAAGLVFWKVPRRPRRAGSG
jgi:hypothetical protein